MSSHKSPIRLIAFASLIGTTIEWYDFFLYNTAAALVFNKLFFPTFDPIAGTMAAFGTYAVGFAARLWRALQVRAPTSLRPTDARPARTNRPLQA